MAPEDHHEERFRELFADHFDALWRFARRRCEDAADADEVVAEAFAIAWRRRSDLPPDGEVVLWLYGVARRVLANQRRSTSRRSRLHGRLREAAATQPTAAASPEEHADGRHPLAVALDALQPADRELLLLRAWDGLAVRDIAVVLGCTPNAASIRLHRARGRLAELLEAKGAVTSRTSAGRPPERREDTP